MDRAYEEAFAEVDEIFKILPIDLLSKIPIKFRQIISENKAKDYKIEIREDFQEEDLKKETVVILGLIYRDFLASPEEREELQKRDAEELQKIEQEMQQQYDMENIFQKRKVHKSAENEEISTELSLYKEPNFVQKVFNLFKRIFNKNKF